MVIPTVLGNTLPTIMIVAPMCSLNDFGPDSTLEAEPIITLMLSFLAHMAIFMLQINIELLR